MKIFVDENIPFGLEAFATHGQVTRFPGRSLKSTDLTHADALIIRSITKINANLLSGTSVRFVATATIGTDHVDAVYLQKQGIGFASAPGCNANSVGEYVCAALTRLEVEKGLTLSGTVLGIIGYGHVGKNVADKAQSLGLKVLYCDPPLRDLALNENADIAVSHPDAVVARPWGPGIGDNIACSCRAAANQVVIGPAGRSDVNIVSFIPQ